MDDILYLVHVVPNEEILHKIKSYGALKRNGKFDDQFPGVYFTLVTKQTLGIVRLFFPAKFILLFSRKLLQQKNYHFNYFDFNGIITKKTLFPWNMKNLQQTFLLDKTNHGNEVVFHDDVSLDYLCQMIEVPKDDVLKHTRTLLPDKPLENVTLPDPTKLPFVLYVDYRIYTGTSTEFYKDVADKTFLKNMAKVAGIHVHGNTSINTILDLIKARYTYLYKHRQKQNLSLLY